MANLWEIDANILNCIDEETGEIIDEEKLNALEMERDRKIENIALWIKNLDSEAEAIKAEAQNLAKRAKTKENRSINLRKYLTKYLAGAEFESTRAKIGYRNTKSTEIFDPEALSKFKGRKAYGEDVTTFKPNKDAIKKAILEGKNIPGCKVVENNNIQIK